MNIVKAIINLQKAVKSLFPTAGDGLSIEVTPRGTIYNIEEVIGDSGNKYKGMFKIIDTSETKDKKEILKIKVINGAEDNDEAKSCGTAHVNRQPFEVLVKEIEIKRDCFIYLKFTAPKEETGAKEETAVGVTVEEFPELQQSDYLTVFHLLGEVKVDKDEKGIEIQQHHLTGNVFIDWYGPCLGLLEEVDDLAQNTTQS